MYLNPMLTRVNYGRIMVYIGHWANLFPISSGKEGIDPFIITVVSLFHRAISYSLTKFLFVYN